jgi:hypothetical protein
MKNSNTIFASVVFLKMQEFARRPVTEQARLRAQLEAVVAVTTAELDAASRIVLDASDGVAIVLLRAPQAALRVAQLALNAGAAGLPLSIGINHGAVRLTGGKGDEGMVGDGIAVAASIAEFASRERLLASRSFRDALADDAPGAEAALVPAGTSSDPSLRRHELFRADEQALARRRRRYVAASAAAAIILFGSGVAMRVADEGRENFVDGVLAKYRDTTAQGENYFRGLLKKVRAQ